MDDIESNRSNNQKLDDRHKRLKLKWIETISTILLSAATILSAWCIYEASQWNGEQYFRIEDENNADRKRMQKQITAHQRTAADAQIFLELVSAITTENEEMEDFLVKRFPPHLKKATLSWKALDPMHNPDAPLSPMQMNDYIIPETKEIEKYADLAKGFKQAANVCDNHSDNYMLLSLILSSVLFFCGLSGGVDSMLNKLLLVGFAAVIFIVTVYFVIIFPVML